MENSTTFSLFSSNHYRFFFIEIGYLWLKVGIIKEINQPIQ